MMLFNKPVWRELTCVARTRCLSAKTAFQLLLFWVMLQVEGVCRGIMQMLGSLTGEYAELLTRLAVKQEPLELGQQLHVGQSS